MNNKTLNKIIDEFVKNKNDFKDSVILNCLNQSSLIRAIELAALSEDEYGKRYSHQCLIKRNTLIKFADRCLQSRNQISNARNFHALYLLIKECKIKGIGSLAIYDTAHRIGYKLDKHPKKIYLHRGTKWGAEMLLGKLNKETIERSELPEPFQREDINCQDIEDILCHYIYKKYKNEDYQIN